jgi:hypothetical protein
VTPIISFAFFDICRKDFAATSGGGLILYVIGEKSRAV